MLTGGTGRVDRLGNPLGGDFAMFYLAGQMAGQGEWSSLYDEPLQQARLLRLMPGLAPSTYLPYRYPPLVAWLMSPLGRLPYEIAWALFTTASLLAWVISMRTVQRLLLPNPDAATRSALIAIALAPVMLQTLMDGQASTFWFAIAAGCWCCLHMDRPIAAGCLLGLAACKPNVLLLLGVVLVVRYPRMLLGVAITGGLMLASTLVIAGVDCLNAYLKLVEQLALQPWSVETPYWKVQSLIAWSEWLLGSAARRTNFFIGLALAIATGAVWRYHTGHRMQSLHAEKQFSTAVPSAWEGSKHSAGAAALCAGLAINTLFNPYTPVYDLTLLCLGLLVALGAGLERTPDAAQLLTRADVRFTLLIILMGPIVSQMVSHQLQWPLQAMPIALTAISAYWCTKLSFGMRSPHTRLCATAR